MKILLVLFLYGLTITPQEDKDSLVGVYSKVGLANTPVGKRHYKVELTLYKDG